MSNKIDQALKILYASGLFTIEEMKDAKANMHEYELNPYTHPGIVAVGISPNKTGELVGISGKQLQAWCKIGRITAYQDYQGWWTIPVSEIIRLKKEVKEKDGEED
jgi:hypothetical protein